MMNKMKFSAALLIPLLLAGCIFAAKPYRGSSTFDLEHPKTVQPHANVVVGLFNNDSPARTHMLYRENGTRLISDEYNSWVQTPELLLQRYLAAVFPIAPDSNTAKMIQLSGTVETFEIDLAQPAAVLHLEYVLRRGETSSAGTIAVSERCDARTPEAFANAMTRAAEHAARELTAAIAKFQKK